MKKFYDILPKWIFAITLSLILVFNVNSSIAFALSNGLQDGLTYATSNAYNNGITVKYSGGVYIGETSMPLFGYGYLNDDGYKIAKNLYFSVYVLDEEDGVLEGEASLNDSYSKYINNAHAFTNFANVKENIIHLETSKVTSDKEKVTFKISSNEELDSVKSAYLPKIHQWGSITLWFDLDKNKEGIADKYLYENIIVLNPSQLEEVAKTGTVNGIFIPRLRDIVCNYLGYEVTDVLTEDADNTTNDDVTEITTENSEDTLYNWDTDYKVTDNTYDQTNNISSNQETEQTETEISSDETTEQTETEISSDITTEQIEDEAIAIPTSSKVMINNVETAFNAYNINDNNYFKLRDIAYELNGTQSQFDIVWDNDKKAINMLSNTPYSGGKETLENNNESKLCSVNNSDVYLDGELINCESYVIDGSNYFKLRDLSEIFDFDVNWNNETKSIEISTK